MKTFIKKTKMAKIGQNRPKKPNMAKIGQKDLKWQKIGQ